MDDDLFFVSGTDSIIVFQLRRFLEGPLSRTRCEIRVAWPPTSATH
jgi:hypothetical protein